MNQGAEAINWHDEDGSFAEDVLHLNIDGLDVIRESDYLQLQLKRMLMGVPERPFLIYTTGQIPPERDDMLLDVRCYAVPFRADAASLRRAELGLAERIDLNNWVTDRKKFLASAARVNKFQPLIEPHDSQNDLDRKALAVLVKSASTEPRDILLSMLDGLNDLDDEPQCWREVESFDLDSAFWDLYGARFGIPSDARNFRAFILRLFATDFVRSCPGTKLGSSVTSMKLDAGNEVAVFMSQWRDSHTKAKSFRRLSKATAAVLKVNEALQGADSNALLSAETFEAIDHKILVKIRNALLKPITDAMRRC